MSGDHHRVSPLGQQLGRSMSTVAERGLKILVPMGFSDTRCASCAYRAGTVPNGCPQTQLDVVKAVAERARFCCHAPKDGRLCAGHVAALAYTAIYPLPKQLIELAQRYEFSPPDEADS